MFPENDAQFSESSLRSVVKDDDGYTVTSDDGWSFSLPLVAGAEPKAGDTMRLYGRGLGYTVRGAFVNGVKFFYRTEAEDEQRNEEYREKQRQDKVAAFKKNKADYDRRFAALPEVFQRRLTRFREGNPNFRVEFEPYEMMVCEQAVLFAEAFNTVDGLQNFAKLSWDEQVKAVPGVDEGHSGNSFGCAVRLAYHYMTNAENVVREHGAMVPLVGCAAYGCTHAGE